MKILIYAYDPGGVSVLTPIIEALDTKKNHLEIYSSEKGLENFEKFGYKAKQINKEIFLSYSDIQNWLLEMEFDVILTGTSSWHNIEKMLWKVAKNIGIKSYAVLDHWLNLSIRFHNNPKECIDYDYSINIKPDQIFVMDEYSLNQLENLGFLKSEIIISGHPKLFQYYKTNHKLLNNMLDNERVVFYSEPIEDIYNSKQRWGFDEYSVIELIFEVVSSIDKNKFVIIKPHPKEKIDDLKIKQYSEKYSVLYEIVDNKFNLKKDDIVVGVFTIALIEAAISGHKVINIIPCEEAFKYSVLALKKVLIPVINKKELDDKIRTLKLIENIAGKFNLNSNPASIIINVMEGKYEYFSN